MRSSSLARLFVLSGVGGKNWWRYYLALRSRLETGPESLWATSESALQLRQLETAKAIATAAEEASPTSEAEKAANARALEFLQMVIASPPERLRILTEPDYPFVIEHRCALAFATTAEVLHYEDLRLTALRTLAAEIGKPVRNPELDENQRQYSLLLEERERASSEMWAKAERIAL